MNNLPTGWVAATLSDITAPASESRAGSSDLQFLGLENVESETTRVLGTTPAADLRSPAKPFEPGDVLYARLRPYLNKVCAPEFAGLASSEFLVFKPRTWLEPKFLMYTLNAPDFVGFANSLNQGVGRPRVRWEQIASYGIRLPPLAEQRRIVAAVDEGVSRLDAAKRSLDDARSRAAALRAGVLAAATAGLETAKLGELVAELRYGTSVKCSYDADGPPVLRIPNVQRGAIDLSDLKYATDAHLDLSSLSLESGDLLFVRTNGSRDLIGRVASVDGAAGMAFASYLIRARPDPARLDSRFAVIALSTPKARAVIESKAATTAGQYNLNLAALRSLDVPIPSIDEQRRIVEEAEHRLDAAKAMEAEIDQALGKSRALRHAILAAALRGELVPQDPEDQPASVLIAQINAQRTEVSKRARSQDAVRS